MNVEIKFTCAFLFVFSGVVGDSTSILLREKIAFAVLVAGWPLDEVDPAKRMPNLDLNFSTGVAFERSLSPHRP